MTNIPKMKSKLGTFLLETLPLVKTHQWTDTAWRGNAIRSANKECPICAVVNFVMVVKGADTFGNNAGVAIHYMCGEISPHEYRDVADIAMAADGDLDFGHVSAKIRSIRQYLEEVLL